MTFTSNFGYDISYYQGDTNFQQMKDSGASFVILRCGYAVYKDSRFDEYITGASAVGIPLNVYHYYDPVYSPTDQANKVISILAPHKSKITRVWLDFEFYWTGNYAAASYWFTYRNLIEAAGYKTGIYTRASWWDEKVTTAQAQDFATRPCWVAQYNTSLTLIPKGWTKAMLWQSGTPAIGLDAGVSSIEIDFDLWNDDFSFTNEWKVAPPITDTISNPYTSVKRVSGVRNSYKFEMLIIDPLKVMYEVVPLSPLENVSSVAKRKGASIGFNGGEWDRVSKPKDYSVSNYTEYVPRVAAVPSFMVLTNKNAVIDHKATANVKEAISGLRYLIRNGVVESYLSGSEPQYTEGHARSIHGIDASGKHLCLTSTGIYPNQGLTLKQAADLMKQYGAVTAFDSGGGGDATVVLNGVSLIVPENISNGVNFERLLPQVLLVYTEASTMKQYKVVWTNGASKRTAPTTSSASITGGVIPVNTVVDVVQDNIPDQTYPTDINKLWVKFPDNTYAASIYGVGSVRMVDVTPPPPVTTLPDLNVTIEATGYPLTKVTIKPL